MENDLLDRIWSKHGKLTTNDAKGIIIKAKNQRRRQQMASLIMSLTIFVLIAYTIYVGPNQWNNFTLGLLLMISSLVLRVLLEFGTLYHKRSQLVSLDNKSYSAYLEHYYKIRLIINYLITPICILAYIYGFYLLLPYFKQEFSKGFYTYILISGVLSLAVIILIIIKSTIKEFRFLNELKHQ